MDFLFDDNETAGILLGYTDRQKAMADPSTVWGFFVGNPLVVTGHIGVLLKFNKTVGKLPPSSFYVSNVAVYSRFRGRGYGRMLMERAGSRA